MYCDVYKERYIMTLFICFLIFSDFNRFWRVFFSQSSYDSKKSNVDCVTI